MMASSPQPISVADDQKRFHILSRQRDVEPPYRTFVIPGHAYRCPQHIRLGVGGGDAVQLKVGLERLGRLLDSTIANSESL